MSGRAIKIAMMLATTGVAALSNGAARAQMAGNAATSPADAPAASAPPSAQDQAAPPPQTATPVGAAQASAETQGLGEIIVTAQRRSENLQKVPIAITAVTAAFADRVGIKSSLDIQNVAPSVNIGSTVGGANVSIRGIQGTGSAGDESANSVYIDGVYNPVGGSLIFGFNNIERIEVLKGPQGTLFGRNASGGAIQIITKDPSYQTHADATIGYGSFNTLEGSFYGTTGITEHLAADFAFYGMHMGDGWGRNVTTGNAAYKGSLLSFRSKVVWQPTDDTKVTGIYSHNENRPASQGGTQVLAGENAPYSGFYNTSTEIDQFNQTNQDNGSIKFEQRLKFATIVNIASVDLSKQLFNIDTDGQALNLVRLGIGNSSTDAKSFTEELQILSPSTSKVSWVAGFYYYYNRIRRNPVVFQGSLFPGGLRTIYSSMPTNSYSGYGQVTVPLGDKLHVTGGLRYTFDDRSITGYQIQGMPPTQTTFVVNGVSTTVVNQAASQGKITYKGAVDYQVTPTAMIYASASRGFKSGFFNITAPAQAPVGPQTVDAYEGGFKTAFLDNRVRLNGSGFYNLFNGVQLRTAGPFGPQFFNAANATIYGADLDLTARPVPALTMQAAVSYLHGKYADFNGPIITFDANSIARENFGLLHDKTSIRSPTLTATLGAVYTIPSEVGEFELAGNVYHNSGFWFDPQNRVRQPTYDIVNASLGWRSANKTFDVKLWVKNLANEQYYTEFNIGSIVGDLYWAAAPRTFGATLGAHF